MTAADQSTAVIEMRQGAVATRSFWRLAFSFPALRAMILVALAVFTVRDRFNDPDLWWHLKLGQIIWNTHSIPRVDVFSFTANGHPWTAHEWLSQVLIYGAYKLGGYSGLMVWLCVFTSLISLSAYILCSLYTGNARVAFVGALATWYFSTVGLAIRPQMIGYLLLVLELLILHLGRHRNPRWFLALPFLFAVWVNCHGSFFLGVIVSAIFLVCCHLNLQFGWLVAIRWNRKQRHILATAFGVSIAALFANPVGLNQVLYPLDVFLHQHAGLSHVMEWQAPPLNDHRTFLTFGVVGLILGRALARRFELLVEELILVIIGFVLAAQHQRMLFVFGILAAPVLCRSLANVWGRYEPERDDRLGRNAMLIFPPLIIIILGFPKIGSLEQQVKKGNPTKAARFIEHAGLPGRMLNDYTYGGYLIWAAPDRKVFIDGRSDVFEWTGVFTDYLRVTDLSEDPRIVLEKYHIGFCLLSHGQPLARVLPLLPGWKEIYSDENSVVLAKSKSKLAVQ